MKRLILTSVVAALAVACGGGSSSGTAPSSVPAPPSKAIVAFNVDPNPVTSEYQGNGWWKFKVNLEFVETGGVGFTINSIRYSILNPFSNTYLIDRDEAMAKKVSASGREVLQFTSANYYILGGLSGRVDVTFVANITDDKGNALTLSNNVTVNHHSAEKHVLE